MYADDDYTRITMWEVFDLIRVFLPRLVLEVLGGAGAMWGFFEVVGARRPSTLWFWRKFALIIGGLFLVRWCQQMFDHYARLVARRGAKVQRTRPASEEVFTITTFELFDIIRIFLPKVVLEVFGASGAMWGFFEVVHARRPETLWFWRPTALIIGGLFLVRWSLNVRDHYDALVARRGITVKKVVTETDEVMTITARELIDIIRIFLPKVVLEIFGSAGAMWGFFEVVGLRNPNTLWFWRPTASVIGGLYMVRWALQLRDHYHLLVSLRDTESQIDLDFVENAKDENITDKDVSSSDKDDQKV